MKDLRDLKDLTIHDVPARCGAQPCTHRKADIRLPGIGDSNSHSARPVPLYEKVFCVLHLYLTECIH